jgi:hypothetical protein
LAKLTIIIWEFVPVYRLVAVLDEGIMNSQSVYKGIVHGHRHLWHSVYHNNFTALEGDV